jgi:hypothetical protein
MKLKLKSIAIAALLSPLLLPAMATSTAEITAVLKSNIKPENCIQFQGAAVDKTGGIPVFHIENIAKIKESLPELSEKQIIHNIGVYCKAN